MVMHFSPSTVSASESRDFMAIILYDGFIRVVISLGAEPLVLTLSRGNRLDDGNWHFIEVRQELKVQVNNSWKSIIDKALL